MRPEDARAAIEMTREPRRRMADAIRVPRWYMSLSVVALAALFAAPALVSPNGPALALESAIAISLLGLYDVVVTRSSGVRVRLHDHRLHRSLRMPLAGLGAAIALGSAATWIARDQVSPGASLAVGACCVATILMLRARTLEAVRADLRADRGGR